MWTDRLDADQLEELKETVLTRLRAGESAGRIGKSLVDGRLCNTVEAREFVKSMRRHFRELRYQRGRADDYKYGHRPTTWTAIALFALAGLAMLVLLYLGMKGYI